MIQAVDYLFNSGWITALALAVLWLGTAAICAASRMPWTLFRSLLANALSGSCLLLAVGVALTDMGVLWVAVLMAGSLVAHGTDLWLRLAVRPRD
ncbi:hypothetical protein ASE36_14610 [Rhizobium sp. Root274]|uniref:hypothetical protein n=1 Tax=unclassified Rhizobium TaxID=2613769 RepID=UPI00071463B9|nr:MULTISPECIES: hypothetical protein [unclassified Rhizobium]KQW29640.1 hypothetical protein ASC71_14630 [Rhizobium sp. Root1240]KRD29832.1 hypothetical protein ASE36_14610 [Rhizobium sp. Root274]